MLKFAIRNNFRHKLRSILTLAIIICGVISILLTGGWINDIYIQLGEALIHSQTGHIQVHKQGYFNMGTRFPEKFLIMEPDNIKAQIIEEINVEKVEGVIGMLNFSGLLNNGSSDLSIICEGVESEMEAKLGRAMLITEGRRLTNKDTFGVLLGQGVANTLKIKVGDHITILTNTLEGALNSFDFEVVGTFQSFSSDYDARAVKISLAAAQGLIGTNSVNTFVVLLKRTEDTDQVANHLTKILNPLNMEIKTWVELNDFYEKTVNLYKGQFGLLQLIILIMVCISVASSVNMSVYERIGEFGTMMALGNRSNQVFQLIILESFLLGVIGASLGIGLGTLLALAISAVGIPMPPPPNADLGYIAQIRVVPSILLLSFIIGLSATVLSSIIPAIRVSRIPILDALRQNY